MYFGAADSADAAYPRRVSFLLGPDGSTLVRYDDVSVGTHPTDVLADAQRLFTPP